MAKRSYVGIITIILTIVGLMAYFTTQRIARDNEINTLENKVKDQLTELSVTIVDANYWSARDQKEVWIRDADTFIALVKRHQPQEVFTGVEIFSCLCFVSADGATLYVFENNLFD